MPANGFTLDAGFNRVQRTLLNLVPKTQQGLRDLTQRAGEGWVASSRAGAVVDTGAYQRSIHFTTSRGGLGVEMLSDVDYWAYLEFGTGGLVDVPEPGFEELAQQFKGQGVRRVNLPARPNLIPNYLKERDKYLAGVQALIRNILA